MNLVANRFDAVESPAARLVIPQTVEELCAAQDVVDARSAYLDRLGRDSPRRALASH
jgi:hypothetical protein